MGEESTVISFRINKKLKKALEDECELKKISVNNALTNMVDNHLKWDKFAQEMGLIFVTKAIFRDILSKISEREIKILATTICRGALRNATVYMKGEFNLENFLEIIDTWLTHSHVPFRRIANEDHVKYILSHDLGSKYSYYIYTAINTLLPEVDCTCKNSHLEDQTLTFEIVKPAK
ncbi:MAG: hypothetical protein GTN97_02235 [Nitrosopumilaceae archaeon]|nr:hypothetical protein [Nitrosopumilaceae archaeon]NIP09971.1 hypothetical protein [Nitrosopumilaceae archaeon]NIS94742.1 hypothetical protein [Nitrosopumilaceae archaeon]